MTSTYAEDGSTDPRPRSGVGGLVVGYGGLGLAAFNGATLPLCYEALSPDVQDACVGMSAVFIVGGSIAAIAGLTVGYRRRADYKSWRERQRAGVRLETAELSLSQGAPILSLRLSF